jgi:preprotein translocase subunit SecE
VNEEQTVQTGGADKVKLAVAVLLVIGGIAAYYLMSDQAQWLRWVAVGAGIALGVGILIPSQYGRDALQFWTNAQVELRKVVWPTRQETLVTTAAVFVFVTVAGVFFWLVDLALAWATRHLTGQGS